MAESQRHKRNAAKKASKAQYTNAAITERQKCRRINAAAAASTSTTPTQRTFDTYELLETILSYLRPRDLLINQRVSTTFKSLIDQSSLLHTTLSPSPDRHERKVWIYDDRNLIKKLDSIPNDRLPQYNRDPTNQWTECCVQRVVINPLLSGNVQGGASHATLDSTRTRLVTGKKLFIALRPRSFRNCTVAATLLLTSPPVQTVTVEWVTGVETLVDNMDGVSMKDILDALEEVDMAVGWREREKIAIFVGPFVYAVTEEEDEIVQEAYVKRMEEATRAKSSAAGTESN